MADTGGFATAAVVSGKLINDFIRVQWTNQVDPVTFQLPDGLNIGGQPVTFQGTLALLAPEITLVRRADNLVAVQLALAGGAAWTAPGIGAGEGLWLLRVQLEIGLAARLNGNQVVAGLDLSAAQVPAIILATLEGPAPPAVVVQALNSAFVRNALRAVLRAIPPGLLQITPATIPDALTFGGVRSPVTNLTVIPDNDALIIAADLTGITAGNPAALIDFRQKKRPVSYAEHVDAEGMVNPYLKEGDPKTHPGAALAVTIDRVALESFVNNVASPNLPYSTWSNDVKLSNLKLRFGHYSKKFITGQRYGLIMTLDATDKVIGLTAGVTVCIGIRLRIHDYSFLYPWQGDDMWQIEVDSIDIDESLIQKVIVAIGVVLAAILPGILTPLIAVTVIAALDGLLPSLLADVEKSATKQVQASITGAAASLLVPSRTLVLPGTTGPGWTVDLYGLIASDLGLDAYSYMRIAGPPQPKLEAPGGVYAAAEYPGDYYRLKPSMFTVTGLAGVVDLDDATVRIAWSMSGLSGKSFIPLQDRDVRLATPGALTEMFDPTSPENEMFDEFYAHVRIYRPLGFRTDEIFKAGMSLGYADRINQSHPYVQWAHQVYFIGDDNTWWQRDRKSVIHRTRPSARCRHVVRASFANGEMFQYLDELPFPLEQANEKRRGVLCDACFFGSPKSTTLKP